MDGSQEAADMVGKVEGEDMALEKIGPHAQQCTEPAQRWAAVAPIVKTVSDVGILDQAKAGAFTVYRHFWPYQDSVTPEQAASDVLASLNGRKPSCVEYKNEWRQFGWENLASHIEETRRFTELMHLAGLKVAGFGFSVGCPEPADWAMVKAAGFAGVDYLSIHEYWGRSNRDTGIAGYLDDWTALRHRRIHDWLGGQHPPFVITESGCDNVYSWGSGWKAQGIDEQTYTNEIMAWSKELAKDSYVIGATIFGSGPYGWADFDTDGFSDRLLVPLYYDQEPLPEPGGGSMSYIDRYPAEYRAWVSAGGAENNFRKHIMAISADYVPTADDIKFLADELKAGVEQLGLALAKRPFAS
jgi:hypothetical protein